MIQSKIFHLNDWNLMVYPSLIGIVFNIKMINSFNLIKSKSVDNKIVKQNSIKDKKVCYKKHIFKLNHHTDYNKACQDLAINKKKQETMWNNYGIEDISTLYYLDKIQKTHQKNSNLSSNAISNLSSDQYICDISPFHKLFSSIDYYLKKK